MFPKQTYISNIQPSQYIQDLTSHWANIKVHFQNYYMLPKKQDMVGMLRSCGLMLSGHHHSGINDCHNIKKICQTLVNFGWDITIPTRSLQNC